MEGNGEPIHVGKTVHMGTNPCGETVHIPIHVGKQSIWGTNPRGAWYEGSNSLINFVTNLLRTLTKVKVKVYSIKHVRLINTCCYISH